jgi:hypothetical protein
MLLRISKPTYAHTCTEVYHTHRVPPTCVGHSCGHLQGGALQRIQGNITEVLNQSTDISMCLSFVGHLLSFYICFIWSIPAGVTLKHIAKCTITQNSELCVIENFVIHLYMCTGSAISVTFRCIYSLQCTWRWPHEGPKHVGGIWCNIHSYTYVHLFFM